jgi:hypothetical protein
MDVMYVNSDAPGETVQGKYAAYPIDRPPQNDIYLADWDVPLPATRVQPLDAPGRPLELSSNTRHSARSVAERRPSMEDFAELLLQLHS